MSSAGQIIQRLWHYCGLLRDDGLSYGDYVEQLTCLLFLKMAHEQTQPPWRRPSPVPRGYDWPSLLARDGEELLQHYRHILASLGRCTGLLGLIFGSAQNKVRDPAKLRRLIVELIDRQQWTALDADVKGAAYEGLLERNALDLKSGAGQYFTPRPLLQAIVEVIRPRPGERICDPACGTGGFLLAAHDHILKHYPDLSAAARRHLRQHALRGVELVDSVTRLCAMNLLLHGIGAESDAFADAHPLPVRTDDSLQRDPGDRFEVVLTNPPFGKRSSVLLSNEGELGRALTVPRPDFWVSSSNKQLCFLQHVRTLLAIPGRAAVVVPDNVLFEGGGAEIVRRRLLRECDVHTLLRLPTGIFYAPGVKASVLFFDRLLPRPGPCTQKLWIYDLRTGMHFTPKARPLRRADLDDFVACYCAHDRAARRPTYSERTPRGRWRAYAYEELVQRDKLNLDLCWLADAAQHDAEESDSPTALIAAMADDLRAALSQLTELERELGE